MFYVYILKSVKDGRLYIGSTVDLKRRFSEHQQGKVISTSHRRPLQLLCYEAYLHKNEAVAREMFLKSSDGHRDLKKRLTVALSI